MKRNQSGFSIVECLLILIIVSILGGAGWYVYSANKKANETLDSADSSSSIGINQNSKNKIQTEIPDGYIQYENRSLGFKFSYPRVYGNFSGIKELNGTKYIDSGEPSDEYGPGISGRFTIYLYSSTDTEISSRKYGPKIQLQNGKWKVTEINEADVDNHKVGDIYKDNGEEIPSQTNGTLTIYTLTGGDEGTIFKTLVFVSKQKLCEINIPAFSDGLYGTENVKQNDNTRFNEMVRLVRDSITTY